MFDFEKKYLNSILCVAVMVTLAACLPAEKIITVGYVQITRDPVLDAAKDGVFRALADSGFIDGQNIKVLDNNAQGDLSMINMILQSLLSQNADLIITSSTPCMTASADNTVYLIINRKACAGQSLLVPETVIGRATRIIN